MSDLLYRAAKLIIGSKEYKFPDFYMDYEVKFDYDPVPDESIIQIYNLNKDSRNNIKKGVPITLAVGYEGDIGTVLDGVVADSFSYKEGTDRITRIKAYNVTEDYMKSKINKSYGKDVTSEYLINDVLKEAGIVPNMIKLGKNITYKRGFIAKGKIGDVIKRLAKDAKSKVVIRNSSISIMPGTSGFETGFLLNSKTGLLSVDKIDETRNLANYRIKMLVNHAVNSRSLLQIDSEGLKGTVLVIEGVHINWETYAEVRVL